MRESKLKTKIELGIAHLDELAVVHPDVMDMPIIKGYNKTYNNLLESDTIIISAFPGCGKTYFYENMKESGLKVIDSDSSTFDKSEFPENYIKHIKDNIGKQDIIMVSSHETVRDAMFDNEIDFVLAFPHINLKNEYIERYTKRGSPEGFIKLINDNWYNWIRPLSLQKGCFHYSLESGEYLSNILDDYEETETNV